MEFYQIADSVTGGAAQGLGFSNFLLNRQNISFSNYLSPCDSSSERVLQLSAVLHPVDVIASPPARSNVKTAPRKDVRRVRRIKRRSLKGGDKDYREDGGSFGDGGVGDGPFGGGGGSGGWNFGRFDWSNWDDSSSPSWSDPAFDFLYENMYQFLKNHFSFIRHAMEPTTWIVDGFSRQVEAASPLQAEAIACRELAKFCVACNLSKVEFFSDSKTIVDCCNDILKPPWLIRAIMKDIFNLSNSTGFCWRHIRREFNGVAHAVASLSLFSCLPVDWRSLPLEALNRLASKK